MRAGVLVAALACLWGSGFLWIRLALDGLTPVQLTWARLVLGALVLGAIVAIAHRPVPRPGMVWAHLAVAALLANVIPYTLFAVAEQTVPSSIAGAINATTPIWAACVGYAIDRSTRPSRLGAIGLLVGICGAILVLEPWSTVDRGSTLGISACVAAAASYGVSYVYQARFLTNRGIPPLVLAALQLALAAAFLTIALPISPHSAPNLTVGVLVAIGILGLLGTGAAYVINFELITRDGATAASTVTYLLPVVAVALGVVFLREPLTWALPAGVLLVLVGTALVRVKPRPT